jgi:hypothetical protein
VDDGDHDGDRFTLLRKAVQAAQRLPGAEIAQRQLDRAERTVLQTLKERLARLEHPALGSRPLGADPAVVLGDLLDRAAAQNTAQAWRYLYAALLNRLVPDEARILAALSDGEAHPLLHVALGAPVGPVARRLLDNVSTIGRTAQLRLQEQVPSYITHLRALGLVQTGPEDKAFEIRYQILESDAMVRRSVEAAKADSNLSVRYLRRTLKTSPLGARLWQACHR